MVDLKTRGKHRRYINFLIKHPARRRAEKSQVLRQYLNSRGYVTPHFLWEEMDDSRGPNVPLHLRKNTIRHAWNLERFAKELERRRRLGKGRVAITIDGPYRTEQHNREIKGAQLSRHVQADASDHFVAQVDRWCRETGLTREQIIAIAKKHFTAVGNETSGTLHFDSRPGAKGSVSFVSWGGR